MAGKSEQESMSRETKWLVSGLVGVALSVLTLGAPGVWYLGQMAGRMEAMQESQKELGETLSRLVEQDISDMKARLTVMEQKQILPRAERELEQLEERVRELERADGADRRQSP